MPAPAAQFSPELPWAAGTRGTIVLKEPVTKEDLLNGALTFVGVNGQLYQPEDNDGYVDYRDENDSQVLSIAFDDDETKNVLVVGVAQDAEVQRVVVGPAVGQIIGITAVTENAEPLPFGQEGFLVAICEKNGVESKAALTQDGRNLIAVKPETDLQDNTLKVLLDRETAVPANSTLKLKTKTATGAVANLPKLQVEIISDNNDAAVLVMHAPCDGTIEPGTGAYLYNINGQLVEWGENVTKIGYR